MLPREQKTKLVSWMFFCNNRLIHYSWKITVSQTSYYFGILTVFRISFWSKSLFGILFLPRCCHLPAGCFASIPRIWLGRLIMYRWLKTRRLMRTKLSVSFLPPLMFHPEQRLSGYGSSASGSDDILSWWCKCDR